MPYSMMKPSAMELMKKGRKDYADVERYCADPRAFLAFLDTLGVERAGLINYVAPKIIGFTPEVNDWSAKYCSVAPDRLIAFGGVLPGTVRDPGAEVDRLLKLGIRAIKMHPSHQVLSPNDYMDGNRGLAAVYERAQANNLPIMIHTGTSIFPGARNLHAQPMLCDDVCIDYPNLVDRDRKSTRLNSSHSQISYAVFCLKKKNNKQLRYDQFVDGFRVDVVPPCQQHRGETIVGDTSSMISMRRVVRDQGDGGGVCRDDCA